MRLHNIDRLNTKKRSFLPEGFSIRKLNDEPYVLKIKNLLTDEEVHELKKRAKGNFQRSNMMADGELYYDEGRTSSTSYVCKDGFPNDQGEIIEGIIKKIRYLVGCKREEIEGFMVVRYRYGEKFDAHYDYFEDHEIGVLDNGGQRIYTFFVYLNTLHEGEGGETEFPKLGIKSKPRRGDAIFWENKSSKTGKMQQDTLHSGNPVTKKGVTKYGLNIWIRDKSFF